MNIEAETLDSLRKLVRELQKENTYLKGQLKKANIVFPENNVFEDKIEDTSEYDPDQGARIASRFITEEMAKQYFAMFWGRTMYMRSGERMAVIFPSVIIAGMTEFIPDKGERRFGVKTVSIQNGQNLRWGRS